MLRARQALFLLPCNLIVFFFCCCRRRAFITVTILFNETFCIVRYGLQRCTVINILLRYNNVADSFRLRYSR